MDAAAAAWIHAVGAHHGAAHHVDRGHPRRARVRALGRLASCSIGGASAPSARVTQSLYAHVVSSCVRDAAASIVTAMDIVAVIIGIGAFALLLLMIEGIDRV